MTTISAMDFGPAIKPTAAQVRNAYSRIGELMPPKRRPVSMGQPDEMSDLDAARGIINSMLLSLAVFVGYALGVGL